MNISEVVRMHLSNFFTHFQTLITSSFEKQHVKMCLYEKQEKNNDELIILQKFRFHSSSVLSSSTTKNMTNFFLLIKTLKNISKVILSYILPPPSPRHVHVCILLLHFYRLVSNGYSLKFFLAVAPTLLQVVCWNREQNWLHLDTSCKL